MNLDFQNVDWQFRNDNIDFFKKKESYIFIDATVLVRKINKLDKEPLC